MVWAAIGYEEPLGLAKSNQNLKQPEMGSQLVSTFISFKYHHHISLTIKVTAGVITSASLILCCAISDNLSHKSTQRFIEYNCIVAILEPVKLVKLL